MSPATARAIIAAFLAASFLVETANGAGAASAVPATEFGMPQSGIAIGITSRSVPSAGGPHVLIDITLKNAGNVTLTIAPIVGARLRLVDSLGNKIAKTGACSEAEATPQPYSLTFAPGDARVELDSPDVTCYAVKPGRDFAVTVLARAHLRTGGPAAAETTVDLQSNTIAVGLPDTLSVTPCAVPTKGVRVVKAVEPEYPLVARELGQTGVALVAVIVDDQGSVAETFVYRSSAAKSLDEASLVAARKSQYAPEIKNCLPVSGLYLFRTEFEMRD